MQPHIYFWEPQVQKFISLNNRVLKMYEDTRIDKDALWDKYKSSAEKEMEDRTRSFNPETYDGGDYADDYEDLISDYADLFWHINYNHLYQYLTILCQTWENILVSFCIKEIKGQGFEFSKYPDYGEIMRIIIKDVGESNIESLGKVRELRHLVNVIKHGDGGAAEKLRKSRPDYFKFEDNKELSRLNDRLEIYDSVFIDGEALNVKEEDLYEYHEAITKFWKSIPERVYFEAIEY